MSIPFHLAFPVTDLDATRAFYEGVLGCAVGRSAPRWVDFDFFGHQISAHLVAEMPSIHTNGVDGDSVPTAHFGAVLAWDDWHALARTLEDGGREFLIPPKTRFQGEPGEQATMFVRDPSGNALEFKSFRDPSKLFAVE